MKGRISSFQSMGAVDGPGLRFVAFAQALPVEHVDVQVMRALREIAVEQRRDVCAALCIVVAQSLRYD